MWGRAPWKSGRNRHAGGEWMCCRSVLTRKCRFPPHVRRAVDRAITKNSEAPARGLPELRVAIAEKVGTEIGHTVDPDRNVLIANGAMQALNLVFRATLDPGDEVIIPSPCYFFGGCVALAGGRLCTCR